MHNLLSTLIMHLNLLARSRCFSFHVLRVFKGRVYDVSVDRHVLLNLLARSRCFGLHALSLFKGRVWVVSSDRSVVLEKRNAYESGYHDIDPFDLFLFVFAGDSNGNVTVYAVSPLLFPAFRFHIFTSPLKDCFMLEGRDLFDKHVFEFMAARLYPFDEEF